MVNHTNSSWTLALHQLFATQGKYEEAAPLYLRAIEIGEANLGADHPKLATWLSNRAELLEAQVRAKLQHCRTTFSAVLHLILTEVRLSVSLFTT